MAELREMLPLCRTRLYQKIKEPDFPEAFQLTENGDYFWDVGEVEVWLETRRCRPGQTSSEVAPPDPEDEPSSGVLRPKVSGHAEENGDDTGGFLRPKQGRRRSS